MDFPEPGGPITSCAKGIFVFFVLRFVLRFGGWVFGGGGGRIVEVGWVCLSDAWVTRLVVRVGAMLILIGGHSGVWFRGRGFNHLLSWCRRTGIYSWQARSIRYQGS